jgi:hypothetical protein
MIRSGLPGTYLQNIDTVNRQQAAKRMAQSLGPEISSFSLLWYGSPGFGNIVQTFIANWTVQGSP